MPTIYDQRSQLDQTVKIFDNFYQQKLVINAAEFDIVYGYFSNTSATKKIAAQFTTFLFRIAQESGINALELLDVVKGTENKLQMNKVICYYLNTFKSKSSLYGIGIIPIPNQPAARNVVQ